jgi:hypothetical protein
MNKDKFNPEKVHLHTLLVLSIRSLRTKNRRTTMRILLRMIKKSRHAIARYKNRICSTLKKIMNKIITMASLRG